MARGRNGVESGVATGQDTPTGTYHGPEPANKSTASPGDFQPEFVKALARPGIGALGEREDLRAIGGHGDRVLKMGRKAAVGRHHTPLVVEHPGLG